MTTSIVRISRRTRLETDGGATLFFVIYSGRRPGYPDPEQVPEFEGDEAWFEVERIRVSRRIWPTWKRMDKRTLALTAGAMSDVRLVRPLLR